MSAKLISPVKKPGCARGPCPSALRRSRSLSFVARLCRGTPEIRLCTLNELEDLNARQACGYFFTDRANMSQIFDCIFEVSLQPDGARVKPRNVFANCAQLTLNDSGLLAEADITEDRAQGA